MFSPPLPSQDVNVLSQKITELSPQIEEYEFKPIGFVRTPYVTRNGTPRQGLLVRRSCFPFVLTANFHPGPLWQGVSHPPSSLPWRQQPRFRQFLLSLLDHLIFASA